MEALITDIYGNRVNGLVVTYSAIYSISDVVVKSGTLSCTGNGIYKAGITLSEPGQYRIEYTSPVGYSDDIETIFIIEPESIAQTSLPDTLTKFDAITVYQGSQTSIYKILDNSPPWTVSTVIRIIGVSCTSLIADTTGQMDIQVSNDQSLWVTYKNVRKAFADQLNGFGWMRCIAVEGLSTAVVKMSI